MIMLDLATLTDSEFPDNELEPHHSIALYHH